MVQNENTKPKVTMCYCLTKALCVYFSKTETYLYIMNTKLQKIRTTAPFFNCFNDVRSNSSYYLDPFLFVEYQFFWFFFMGKNEVQI